jgi:Major Facilitator Superfamily
LIADLTPQALRGAGFGLRQALDTVGAVVGPLIAILLMWITANRFQTVFWFAVIPAVFAVALLIVGVKEPDRPIAAKLAHNEHGDIGVRDAHITVSPAVGTGVEMGSFMDALTRHGAPVMSGSVFTNHLTDFATKDTNMLMRRSRK